jgi:FtsH-binding integral membrane protein
MTDRFAPFTPCFVKRHVYPADSNNKPRYDKMDGKTYNYETEELWFPGAWVAWWACTYVRNTYVCMHVCTYVCMHAYMYVCVCIQVCMCTLV